VASQGSVVGIRLGALSQSRAHEHPHHYMRQQSQDEGQGWRKDQERAQFVHDKESLQPLLKTPFISKHCSPSGMACSSPSSPVTLPMVTPSGAIEARMSKSPASPTTFKRSVLRSSAVPRSGHAKGF
jgi:hypothetical protein